MHQVPTVPVYNLNLTENLAGFDEKLDTEEFLNKTTAKITKNYAGIESSKLERTKTK
jgi:hypothetical protein